MSRSDALASPPAVVVGLAGAALAILVAAVSLMGSDGDPSGIARFGELTPQQTDYAESRVEREVFVRDSLGHDGKFFFIQANDPLLLAPTEHASALDRPTYRSQRMLYPAIAGVLAGFNPHAILWTLIAVNVFMLGLGTWAVAVLAQDARISSWFGLAFAVNTGLIYSLLMDGATITALALGCVGVLAVSRQHAAVAVAAFTGAVLAREVMVLFAVGVALGMMFQRRSQRTTSISVVPVVQAAKVPGAIVVIPAAAAVMWAVYVRWRVSFVEELVENEEITPIPLAGLLRAVSSGSANLVDLLMVALLLVLVIGVPLMAWKTQNLLLWGAAPFSVLALFLTVNVWQYNYNISRALAPLFTAAVLGVGLMLMRARSEPAEHADALS